MKYVKATLIALALAVATAGIGAAGATDTYSEQEAARCQRCGDGYCAKSCENAQTCPQDCGGTPSAR